MAQSGGLSARLRAAQDDWLDSQARQAGVAPPDGEYEGVIKDVVVGESKSEKKRLQCTWTLRCTDGQWPEDRDILKFSGLETKDNMDWFKGDLEALELKASKRLDRIGDVLNEAIDLRILFKVRTRDEFTNIDFIERLDGDAPVRGNGDPDPMQADEYTVKEIDGMCTDAAKGDEAEIRALIKAESMDIEPDDYVEWEEVGDLVKEKLGL